VSSDIYTEFDYATLRTKVARIAADPVPCTAHFVLVDNPPWHSAGDMGLAGDVVVRDGPRLTYGNIAVFHPGMFTGIAPGTWLKLFPWAYRFVEEGRVTGEHYTGEWDNIGTPAQLADLDRRLRK
jgi:MurNAc alpha-1-phosphate uridylyltransferase